MSRLRAKCPFCRAYTAVALGPDYECHACGRHFAAGLVRVPRAWGEGGETMVEAARLPLAYPEAGVVEEDSPSAQAFSLALELPERPLILGGCCCAHVGAVEALAARHGRVSLIWFDAHGDLNTPETSLSGNEWGMPLRTLLDSGAVDPRDVALIGARALDPSEVEYIAAAGLHTSPDAIPRAVEGTAGVYVALDFDVFSADEAAAFMPEPGGMTLTEGADLLRGIATRAPIVGAGLSGLAADERNVEAAGRLLAPLGL